MQIFAGIRSFYFRKTYINEILSYTKVHPPTKFHCLGHKNYLRIPLTFIQLHTIVNLSMISISSIQFYHGFRF